MQVWHNQQAQRSTSTRVVCLARRAIIPCLLRPQHGKTQAVNLAMQLHEVSLLPYPGTASMGTLVWTFDGLRRVLSQSF